MASRKQLTNAMREKIRDEEGTQVLNNDFEIKMLTDSEKKTGCKQYRAVFDTLKQLNVDSSTFEDTLGTLSSNLDKQNDTMKQYGINETMALDSKCYSANFQITHALVKTFQAAPKIDFDKLNHSLQSHIVDLSRAAKVMPVQTSKRIYLENLYGLSLAIRKRCYKAPAFMNGLRSDALEIEARPLRKARLTQTKNKTQATQAKELNEKEMQGKVDESDLRLRKIHDRLYKLQTRNQGSGIPLVEVCIHPQSFSTTVENFFNMAFLARQNLVSIMTHEEWCRSNGIDIDPNDNGDPVVIAEKSNLPNGAQDQSADGEEQAMDVDEDGLANQDIHDGEQSILTLDQTTINKLVRKLDVQRPALH